MSKNHEEKYTQAELYKLPKDLLIKLICNLEKDLRVSIRKEYEDELTRLKVRSNVLSAIDRRLYITCDHHGCPSYRTTSAIPNDDYWRSTGYHICNECNARFCERHSKMYSTAFTHCRRCVNSLGPA